MVTSIEWTDVTWNPTRGCSRVSTGCENCYAEKIAHRFRKTGQAYFDLTNSTKAGPRWNGKVRVVPAKIDEPLAWGKPRRVFVDSMSDLFHEAIPESAIRVIFEVMVNASSRHGHTFQVLTKRPERMRDIVSRLKYVHSSGPVVAEYPSGRGHLLNHRAFFRDDPIVDVGQRYDDPAPWDTPPGTWLGISAENQATLDERIPFLLETPAAVRFLSLEPLLGPIHFKRPEWIANYLDGIDWVIVGAESGSNSRPVELRWIRDVVRDCRKTKTPVFVKQLGRNWALRNGRRTSGRGDGFSRVIDLKGGDPSQWPRLLRVREYPPDSAAAIRKWGWWNEPGRHR